MDEQLKREQEELEKKRVEEERKRIEEEKRKHEEEERQRAREQQRKAEEERLMIERERRRKEIAEKKRLETERRNKEIDDRVLLKLQPMMDRIDQLTKMVDTMEKELNMDGNNDDEKVNGKDIGYGDNDGIEAVKLWLKEKVELPQYTDIFLKHGIDKLSVVVLLEKSTLKEMGIYKIGHQLIILDQIQKLKGR